MPAELAQRAAHPQGGGTGLVARQSVFLVTSLPRLAKKLPVRGDGTSDLKARR